MHRYLHGNKTLLQNKAKPGRKAQKYFLARHVIRRGITALKSIPNPYPKPDESSQYTIPSFLKTYFNIILNYALLSSKSSLSLGVSPQSATYISNSSYYFRSDIQMPSSGMIEADTSETSQSTYQNTRRYSPENSNPRDISAVTNVARARNRADLSHVHSPMNQSVTRAVNLATKLAVISATL